MRNVAVLIVLLLGLLSFGSAAHAGGRPQSTALSGAQEVHPQTGALGAGDPDASGFARITLNQGQGEICVAATVADTSTLEGAHIHAAPAGANGPVVVHFTPLIDGLSIKGCVSVDSALVKAIRKNPQAYYINIHSIDYPAGAVRGQLKK